MTTDRSYVVCPSGPPPRVVMASPCPTLHTLGCYDAACAETYGCAPGEARFQCVRCDRWVGYCMGANDEMPALCDDCFCFIWEAPNVD